ncbi:phage protease [Polaromonas sp. P2-4]|nr:phage protease [Polaromonas sp. P2-4]
MAALAATAALASCAVPVGRHFLLEDKNTAPGTVRFLSQAIELADDSKTTWVTITRTGDFNDPRYGNFSITPVMLAQMVSNFDKGVIGQDVYFDVAHKHSDGAAAKILRLAVEGGKLRALVEWTPFGIDAVKSRGFTYLSAEFHENWTDNEKGVAHGCVLLGAGLTIRPVIKNLDPVLLSTDDDDHAAPVRRLISPNLLKQLTESDMKKYLEMLLARLVLLSFTDVTAKPLLDAAEKQLATVATDDAKCLAVVESFAVAGDAAMKQIKAGGGNVTVTLAAPQTVDVAGEVTRLLAERDTANANAKTSLEAKHKLLSDTIAAGDKTLTPDGVKKFAEEYAPMISALTTDDQVKHLASLAVKQAQQLSAAVKLASMGYQSPSGSVHISVDSSNEVKSLQQTIDTRLGLTKETDDKKRFYGTGGMLLAANKRFAELALAEYDRAHGMQLHNEHKALSAGTGTISDIKAPYSVERTVLRESLYNLISLNFMDVGTERLAPSIQIPYSYRDLTAAGTGQARIYERQGIRSAGVVQTWDTAYPIPQKLAFSISNEMQYLLAASPINFDPISENVANIVRIVGEDTEALNLNEIVRSADEYLVAAGNDTLTADVNGTKKVFVTTQFPVVRPRTQYDLQGSVAVAATNPIVVTLNSVARLEYLPPADGTALAAGTYWTMDYNLGELRFVTELGASVTPTNAWPLVVTYSYSTNVSKFNIDLGSQTVGQRYDDLLTAIGARRVVIEDDRYYSASMNLMTGGVNNALGQATTFTANAARGGYQPEL